MSNPGKNAPIPRFSRAFLCNFAGLRALNLLRVRFKTRAHPGWARQKKLSLGLRAPSAKLRSHFYPCPMYRTPYAAVAGLVLACLSPALYARVGEPQQALESRLLSSSSAARIPDQDLAPKSGRTTPLENEFTEEIGSVQRPDGGSVVSPIKIAELMPPGVSADFAFYLKTDTGRPTGINVTSLRNWVPNTRRAVVTNKDRADQKDADKNKGKPNVTTDDAVDDLRMRFTGWELMVLYANKVSALEVYRRINSYITPAELEGILALNGGAGAWKKTPKENRVDSLLPYDYETADGKLRARAVLNGTNLTSVVVFNAQMADALRQAQVTRKQQQQATRDVGKSLDLF